MNFLLECFLFFNTLMLILWDGLFFMVTSILEHIDPEFCHNPFLYDKNVVYLPRLLLRCQIEVRCKNVTFTHAQCGGKTRAQCIDWLHAWSFHSDILIRLDGSVISVLTSNHLETLVFYPFVDNDDSADFAHLDRRTARFQRMV